MVQWKERMAGNERKTAVWVGSPVGQCQSWSSVCRLDVPVSARQARLLIAANGSITPGAVGQLECTAVQAGGRLPDMWHHRPVVTCRLAVPISQAFTLEAKRSEHRLSCSAVQGRLNVIKS